MEQSIINSKTIIILFLTSIYAIKCSDLILFGCDSFNAQFIWNIFYLINKALQVCCFSWSSRMKNKNDDQQETGQTTFPFWRVTKEQHWPSEVLQFTGPKHIICVAAKKYRYKESSESLCWQFAVSWAIRSRILCVHYFLSAWAGLPYCLDLIVGIRMQSSSPTAAQSHRVLIQICCSFYLRKHVLLNINTLRLLNSREGCCLSFKMSGLQFPVHGSIRGCKRVFSYVTTCRCDE